MTMPAHKTCPRCQQPALLNAETCGLCGQPFPPVDTGLTRSSFSTEPSASLQPQTGQTGDAPYPAPYAAQPPTYANQPPAYPGQTLYAPPYAGQTPPPYPQGYQQSYPPPQPYGAYGQPYPVAYTQQKNKTTAALLAFFLGSFGVHGFYLGNTAMGASLLTIWLVSWPLLLLFGLGLLGFMAIGIITLIQTILYATASDQDFYQKYVVEKRWL